MTATCKTCRHYSPETYKYKELSLGTCGNELVLDAWKYPERDDLAMAGDGGLYCGPRYYCPHHESKEPDADDN